MPLITPDRRYYPKSALIFHRYAQILAGAALSVFHTASQDFGYTAYQNPAANGDSWWHALYLAGGVYTMDVLGSTQNYSGKLDWYLDGVLVLAGQDWYAGAGAFNVVKTATVTVNRYGQHVLRGVVNGLTVPSAGYNITLSAIAFY